jgi:hypothetical protein
LQLAKASFNKSKELLTKGLKKDLNKRKVKTLVWPMALYGRETWPMKKEIVDKLNAFGMWVWRRMETESWQDKKTNVEVLAAVGEERCFVQAIVKRKKELDRTCCAREQIVKACDRGKNGLEESKREAKDGHDW